MPLGEMLYNSGCSQNKTKGSSEEHLGYMKSLGLSQQDTLSRNKWRRKIEGATI